MNIKPQKALILGAGPNGLGALRSLSVANVQVDIITINEHDPALLSRLAERKIFLTKPFCQQELLTLLMNWPEKGHVLIPTSDLFVDFLQENQKLLAKHFSFILPPGRLSNKLIDKKEEVKIVSPYVQLPKTLVDIPGSPDLLLQEISLPLIIKPRSNELNKLKQKNIPIYSNDALIAFYDKFSDVLSYCIVQEMIIGNDSNLWVCNCTFDHKSELINAFTFQRLQLTPPHFGVTCYAISKVNHDVLAQVKTLGKGLHYVGPAMVEFKLDDKDGLYKYIEINPRLGLCNYFDTCCGKNNVYALYCLATDTPFIEIKQKENRMFLSAYEDLYSRFRDQQKPLSIASTYLSNVFKSHTFMYFAWRDPWPAIVMFYRQGKRTFKSIINKVK